MSSVDQTPTTQVDERNLMARLRRYVSTYWPYERLLPSDEPVYVTRLFYMFGSMALMAFVSLIVTGVVLVMKGPFWWHSSDCGLFFNSLHFWSVQVFFFSIFVHFGSSFFTAAWRGGRGFTWLFGVAHLPHRGPDRADRVRAAVQLRRPVHRPAGQGRDERRRPRVRAQPDEPRQRDRLAHRDPAARRRRGPRAAPALGAPSRGGPPFPAAGSDFEGEFVTDGPTRDDRSSSTQPAQRIRAEARRPTDEPWTAPWKSSDVAWRGGKRPYDLIKELMVSGTVVAVAGPRAVPAVRLAGPARGDVQGVGHAGRRRTSSRPRCREVDATSLSATYGPPYQTTAQNGSTQGFGPLSPETVVRPDHPGGHASRTSWHVRC